MRKSTFEISDSKESLDEKILLSQGDPQKEADELINNPIKKAIWTIGAATLGSYALGVVHNGFIRTNFQALGALTGATIAGLTGYYIGTKVNDFLEIQNTIARATIDLAITSTLIKNTSFNCLVLGGKVADYIQKYSKRG